MTKKKTEFTVPEIVEFLRNEEKNETIEGQLLRRQLIRELYKQLGVPSKEDFEKEMYPAGTYWSKRDGYTTYIEMHTESYMRNSNTANTAWCIKRPSAIKQEIEREYRGAGWSVMVQAFNVMCDKYVKHPRYENLWVRFYSSRDCNKYEYVIEVKENE